MCVRRGTETESKFTSVEKIMGHALVRPSCERGSKAAVYTAISDSSEQHSS